MRKIAVVMCALIFVMCTVVSLNGNSQVFIRVKYGIQNVNTDSTNAYFVNLLSVDSLRIDSVGNIAQHSAVVYVNCFYGTFHDTVNITLTGLTTNSTYLCKVKAISPQIESGVTTFTTLACPFVASIGYVVQNMCTDSVYALPAGAQYLWFENGSNIAPTTQGFPTQFSGGYSCKVTKGGCTDTSPVLNIVIDGITVGATTSQSVICFGSSVNLNATGADSYVWSPTTGLSDPNVSDPTATPAATTTYVVVGTTGNCSGTATVKVTVNKNNTTVTISSSDSACNKGASATLLNGTPANGTFSGQFVVQDYFIPDTSFVGASEVTYTVTDNNGCEASKTKTIWVIDSPIVDTMYFVGSTFVVEGWFPLPITGNSGDGINHIPTDQSGTQALFQNWRPKNGDGITIRSQVGGCFVFKPFHQFGMGISNLDGNTVIVKEGDVVSLIDMNGRIISTITAPKDFTKNEIFELQKQFETNPPPGMYFWRDQSTQATGKIDFIGH
jgi:hypothetical protein